MSIFQGLFHSMHVILINELVEGNKMKRRIAAWRIYQESKLLTISLVKIGHKATTFSTSLNVFLYSGAYRKNLFSITSAVTPSKLYFEFPPDNYRSRIDLHQVAYQDFFEFWNKHHAKYNIFYEQGLIVSESLFSNSCKGALFHVYRLSSVSWKWNYRSIRNCRWW